jgi:uncharacterized protein (TIGR00251 family)
VVPEGGGSLLRVHVRPGASRPGVAGLHAGALALRVAARPLEGAANREVLAMIARALDVAPSTVELVAGARGRDKRVRIRGLDPAAVERRLASRLRV